MKMSLTRALRELKLVNDRIDKKVGRLSVVSVAKGENPTFISTNAMSVSDFQVEAKSSIESVESLMRNADDIKKALLHANNTVTVVVGKETMTIAQAVDKKHRIETKKRYLHALRKSLADAEKLADRSNSEVESEVQRLREISMGNDASKAKTDQIKAIEIEKKHNIVQPKGIDVRAYILKIEEEIEYFETEIDFILSEVNAKTEIEVDGLGE